MDYNVTLIKSVIFDVGGVLVRTHDQSSRRKWEARLGLKPGSLAQLVFNSEPGCKAQLGQASSQEVWAWVGTHLGLNRDELATLKHDFWAGDQVDHDLCDYIRRLRTRYHTGMLSNSWARDSRAMAKKFGFADCFDVFVTSAEVGVMKPDARIYQIAMQRLGVSPSESVFVDDFSENIEAARRLGMYVIQFAAPAQAREQLEELLGA
jgi:epoxide hydrolase-like predicted phosphatase